MLGGQLKPGYNFQISTENQCILGYTIHQTTNDTTTLQTHMESLKENLGKMPDTLVADAGYESEENYEYLEKNNVKAYVKYNYFHKEQSNKWKTKPDYFPWHTIWANQPAKISEGFSLFSISLILPKKS